ncbi:unnamed protein product [Clonostachys rosea f. rosea IK726]|uniref:Uncharacterized protein n=1 Tax=Clonostachys rosea f. rosea IK726 TaxID=1349383 RepID=A0ACA9TY62_BIOOC|nr:unnamed protein product [Clonostachys rosea f. rosea IK726]
MSSDSPKMATHIDKSPARVTRAKRACRECNVRRVRCDVTERYPCSNCEKGSVSCEIFASRRGRYPRKPRKANGQASPATPAGSLRTPSATGKSVTVSAGTTEEHHQRHTRESEARATQSQALTPPDVPASSVSITSPEATVFYGESNFITLMPGPPRQEGNEGSSNNDAGQGRRRHLEPPLNVVLPRAEVNSNNGNTPPSSYNAAEDIPASTLRLLREEQVLEFPDQKDYIPVLEAYFTWFHPCFPILDRRLTAQHLANGTLSPLLLNAMLFLGSTYCTDEMISNIGFQDRAEAKARFYTKTRLLYSADWEQDKITLIQSVFLMSFWRGGPSDIRDVRYWLGVVISLAESQGLHRSTKFTAKGHSPTRLRRRIWWSIYVRERQAAASLGLPSRIRDEDCDTEPLLDSDLSSEVVDPEGFPFGSCQPNHMVYVIKMVEIAKLLGRVIDLYFLPGRSSPQQYDVQVLDNALYSWFESLPEDVKNGIDSDNAPIWTCLLHLAYYHLRILIHRNSFMRQRDAVDSAEMAYHAATRISRIAEDLLTRGALRFGQMHLITSLFAALCIHVVSIRRGTGVARRIAENRAQACLLGLQEIQKYWRINNNVLDVFMQFVDNSIMKQLRGTSDEMTEPTAIHQQVNQSTLEQPESSSATNRIQNDVFEDPHLFMWNGYWEGNESTGDLGAFLTEYNDFEMDVLEKPL